MATTKTESARVALPGRMYRKDGRWWWSVQLPGESRCRARALRAPQERTATRDRRVAEVAALKLWQDAVRAEAQAEILTQVKNQSAEKSRAYAYLIDQITDNQSYSTRQTPWTAPSTFQVQTMTEIETVEYKPVPQMPIRPLKEPVSQECEPLYQDLARAQGQSLDLMDILSESTSMQDRHGCECCGSKDFFDEYLQVVESGQKLCPRCVRAMREDTLSIV